MKYREYNIIIEEYKKMALEAQRKGNESAAKHCQVIVEDLELLRTQGALGLFPSKGTKEKEWTWTGNTT